MATVKVAQCDMSFSLVWTNLTMRREQFTSWSRFILRQSSTTIHGKCSWPRSMQLDISLSCHHQRHECKQKPACTRLQQFRCLWLSCGRLSREYSRNACGCHWSSCRLSDSHPWWIHTHAHTLDQRLPTYYVVCNNIVPSIFVAFGGLLGTSHATAVVVLMSFG